MNNYLLHIGLQVNDKDIERFYLTILHGTIIQQFELLQDLSECIFEKNEKTMVYHILCQGVYLELFTNNTPIEKSYSHVCLHVQQAKEIAEAAINNGFHMLLRESKDKTTTYFIRDSNNNLFELKE